jgi:hypothetical protein
MSSTDTGSSKRGSKRRWLQFSLRTMLLAVTAVAVWLGLHFYPAQRQRRAVEAIEALGGTVGYDDQVIGQVEVRRQKDGAVAVQGLRRFGRRKSRVPTWVRNLLGDDLFCTVTWVRMTGPEISDEALASIAELPRLRYLDLSGTGVTNDGLKYLAGLTQLEELDLSRTPVRDNGLAHVSTLSNLRRLNLQTTRTTTEGMKHLAALHRLRALEVGTTWIDFSDYRGNLDAEQLQYLRTIQYLGAIQSQSIEFSDPSNFNRPLPKHGGLSHLKQLNDLEFLDVTYTHVTAAEVQELQKALPNLAIQHPGILIAQNRAMRKRLLNRVRVQDSFDRHDEGMLFDAWQRRRQWRGNVPGGR